MPNEIITTREVAEMLGMSRQAVWKAVATQRLPEPIRKRGRTGSYWLMSKSLVYILNDLKYNKIAGNVSPTRNRRIGK